MSSIIRGSVARLLMAAAAAFHCSMSGALAFTIAVDEHPATVAFEAADVAFAGAKAAAAVTTGSTLALTGSAFAIVAPTQVTLTATVSGTALKGNITFKSGANKIGIGTINKNVATLTIALQPAIHSLTATFTATGGDIVSPAVNLVVDNALSCG